jgi:hypothetical protein
LIGKPQLLGEIKLTHDETIEYLENATAKVDIHLIQSNCQNWCDEIVSKLREEDLLTNEFELQSRNSACLYAYISRRFKERRTTLNALTKSQSS